MGYQRLVGAWLSATLLVACGAGNGVGNGALPVSAAARSNQRARAAEKPFSKLSTCKALAWCNQLDVTGDLMAGGTKYVYDSCENAQQPGCLDNVQSDAAPSVANHSVSFDGTASSFDERSGSYIGGIFRYSSMTSTSFHGQFGDSQVIISGLAYDTLYPLSKTLPKGSQVKLAVTLKLTPATDKVDCSPTSSTEAELGVAWAWVASAANSLSVTGDCNGDAFDYFVSDKTGNESLGRTIAQTFTVIIGKSYRFEMFGFASTSATYQCEGNSCQDGIYDSELSGSSVLTIKSLTSGATFKTASGFVYSGS